MVSLLAVLFLCDICSRVVFSIPLSHKLGTITMGSGDRLTIGKPLPADTRIFHQNLSDSLNKQIPRDVLWIQQKQNRTSTLVTPMQKNHIDKFKYWNTYKPTEISKVSSSKIMILPLAFILAFIIGLGIKATHWWNEDIRHADGLLVNVYTPHKAHRRVLARIYSTEPSSEEYMEQDMIRHKLSRQASRPDQLILAAGSHNASSSSLYGYEIDEDDDDVFGRCDSKIMVNANSRSVVRPKRQVRNQRPSSVGNQSPTESLCSRCRYIDEIEARLSERDLRDKRADLINIHKMPPHSRKLKRQLSTVSTQSAATVRSEICSESVPLLLARGCMERLTRKGHMADMNNRGTLMYSSDRTPNRKPHRIKKLSPLARRANSESNIEKNRIRNDTKQIKNSTDSSEYVGINTLLKNSLNLNINLLNSISLSSTKHRPLQVLGISSVADDSGRGKLSPNQTSQRSSSVFSSSDKASSTSAGTSVTALFSSASSTSSISGTLSRQNSKKHMHMVHGKHFLLVEKHSKCQSVPSLKTSQRILEPKAGSGVMFSLGNEELNLNGQRGKVIRSWSGSNWKDMHGETNTALSKSASMDTVFMSKECVSICLKEGNIPRKGTHLRKAKTLETVPSRNELPNKTCQ